jgi:hypothetical protein
MTAKTELSAPKRRTRAEVQQLVAEFVSSGMRRSEFCQSRGLSLSTLDRHLRKLRWLKRFLVITGSRKLEFRLDRSTHFGVLIGALPYHVLFRVFSSRRRRRCFVDARETVLRFVAAEGQPLAMQPVRFFGDGVDARRRDPAVIEIKE